MISPYPPIGLKSFQVPQFIVLGFDDNQDINGMLWMLKLLDKKRNPSGSGNINIF